MASVSSFGIVWVSFFSSVQRVATLVRAAMICKANRIDFVGGYMSLVTNITGHFYAFCLDSMPEALTLNWCTFVNVMLLAWHRSSSVHVETKPTVAILCSFIFFFSCVRTSFSHTSRLYLFLAHQVTNKVRSFSPPFWLSLVMTGTQWKEETGTFQEA